MIRARIFTVVPAVLLGFALSALCEEPAAPAGAGVAPPARFAWRLDGGGVFSGAKPVSEWSVDGKKNVLWTADVGSAFSSPVIAGGKVFVTSEMEDLVCVEAATGKVLWKKTTGFAELPKEPAVEEKRSPTSCGFSTPTPVVEGDRVYVVHGTGIVGCYDTEGKRIWIKYFDQPPATGDGRSASPVLAAGKLLVTLSDLIALDPKTGEVLWEAKEAVAAYGTPAAAKIGAVDVAITPTGFCVRLSDGVVLAKNVISANYTTPVIKDGIVYVADSSATALKLPDEAAPGMKAKRLWETDLGGEMFSSPVVHEGVLYALSNEGMLWALDAAKGEKLFEKHLEIPSAGSPPGMPAANLFPSLAVADGRLFIGNDTGTCLVLGAVKEYKELATSSLPEGSGASVVFDGERLYLRGGKKLYCIGAK